MIIRIGISTCPNDTFAFHGILNHQVDLQGIQFEFKLLDIEELNQGVLEGAFDVAKASFALAQKVADSWVVLPSGSALGFGVGPLLLAATENALPRDKSQVTLCPGEHTTANLLFQLFYGQTKIKQTVFSEIMPALQSQQADFGVCIHEGRFTYGEQGLWLVEDLGIRWENATGFPLPLGGILARCELGHEVIRKVQNVIRSSVEYGLRHRDDTLPTMRKFAQEFDDQVLMQHVDLYVNEWTVELGPVGRQSLQEISRRCIEVGGNESANRIEVFR